MGEEEEDVFASLDLAEVVLPSHTTWVVLHDVRSCHAAKVRGGHCGTTHEALCTCGFIQGTCSYDDAHEVARIHRETGQTPVWRGDP